MNDIIGDIDNIRKLLFIDRFKNELNTLTASTITTDEIKQRIEQLKQIISKIESEKETNSKDKLFAEIDKVIYKRPWGRLSTTHRLIKIKQYLNTNITDNELRDKILTDVTKYINDGKLNSKKYVVYDPAQEKVLSFPALKIEEKSFNIKI